MPTLTIIKKILSENKRFYDKACKTIELYSLEEKIDFVCPNSVDYS